MDCESGEVTKEQKKTYLLFMCNLFTLFHLRRFLLKSDALFFFFFSFDFANLVLISVCIFDVFGCNCESSYRISQPSSSPSKTPGIFSQEDRSSCGIQTLWWDSYPSWFFFFFKLKTRDKHVGYHLVGPTLIVHGAKYPDQMTIHPEEFFFFF